MTPKIGSYAVALAILFASTAAFGQTLAEALRLLRESHSAHPAGIRFDDKGVNFGPWLWKFSARVKRHWTVPGPGITTERGTVDVTFYVQRDGTIAEVKITRSSGTPRFDSAALDAVIRSSPAPPLPGEYPDDRVFFTVTFQYNPETLQNPTPVPTAPSELPVIDNPRSLRNTAPALEVFTIDGGTIYHRENCISLVGHRKVKVADIQATQDITVTWQRPDWLEERLHRGRERVVDARARQTNDEP